MSHDNRLLSMLSLMEDVFAKNSSLEELKGMQRKIEESLKNHWEFLGALRGQADSARKEVENLHFYRKEDQEVSQDLKKQIESLISAIDNLKTEINRRLKPLEDTIVAAKDSLRKEFEKRIDELKSSLVLPPSVVFQQNEEAMKKMEVTRMDAMNAMSKATNTDNALKLLERRIDNLAIQIQKIDIDKSKK